jgi:hypothetical protein
MICASARLCGFLEPEVDIYMNEWGRIKDNDIVKIKQMKPFIAAKISRTTIADIYSSR